MAQAPARAGGLRPLGVRRARDAALRRHEPAQMTLVVPATDEPACLERCLASIMGSTDAPDQLVVVNDPAAGGGPGAARNAGTRLATGDVLVFVDADVCLDPLALERIRERFAADPELTAVFGSYDDDPDAPGVVSSFRNLLHHHVHQRAAGPARTFWAGIGAVRRDAFEAAGGFDPDHPIEDIELGMRLARNGAKVELDPAVQGKHLKRWTLATMLKTDLLVRGAPWVDLMIRHRAPSNALNLGWRHRLSAVSVIALCVACVTTTLALGVVGIAALVGFNFSFYRLLLRRRGPLHAVAGVGLHALHHLVAVAAVPAGLVLHAVTRRRQAWPERRAALAPPA